MRSRLMRFDGFCVFCLHLALKVAVGFLNAKLAADLQFRTCRSAARFSGVFCRRLSWKQTWENKIQWNDVQCIRMLVKPTLRSPAVFAGSRNVVNKAKIHELMSVSWCQFCSKNSKKAAVFGKRLCYFCGRLSTKECDKKVSNTAVLDLSHWNVPRMPFQQWKNAARIANTNKIPDARMGKIGQNHVFPPWQWRLLAWRKDKAFWRCGPPVSWAPGRKRALPNWQLAFHKRAWNPKTRGLEEQSWRCWSSSSSETRRCKRRHMTKIRAASDSSRGDIDGPDRPVEQAWTINLVSPTWLRSKRSASHHPIGPAAKDWEDCRGNPRAPTATFWHRQGHTRRR